jgi:hypothetical protein
VPGPLFRARSKGCTASHPCEPGPTRHEWLVENAAHLSSGTFPWVPNIDRHPEITDDAQLWTRRDIARFLQRSPSYVYLKTQEPGFPAPAGCDKNRWWPSDVRKFSAPPDPHALTDGILGHAHSSGRVTRQKASR